MTFYWARSGMRCAWCSRAIRCDGIEDHGVPYHPGCWATRAVWLREEIARRENAGDRSG